MGIIPSHHVLGGTPVLFPNAQRILYVIALSNIEEYSTIAGLTSSWFDTGFGRLHLLPGCEVLFHALFFTKPSSKKSFQTSTVK